MNRLSCLSTEKQKKIEEKIPVQLDQADEIIMKVLYYHTAPDEEFMKVTKQLNDKNSKDFTDLPGL